MLSFELKIAAFLADLLSKLIKKVLNTKLIKYEEICNEIIDMQKIEYDKYHNNINSYKLQNRNKYYKSLKYINEIIYKKYEGIYSEIVLEDCIDGNYKNNKYLTVELPLSLLAMNPIIKNILKNKDPKIFDDIYSKYFYELLDDRFKQLLKYSLNHPNLENKYLINDLLKVMNELNCIEMLAEEDIKNTLMHSLKIQTF